jgi:hypothetical protein
MCIILDQQVVTDTFRILPFDTGAFSHKIMHPPIHEGMKKEDFELAVSATAPMRVIQTFYGSEKQYFNSLPKPHVDEYDPFEDFEIDSYFRLLHKKDRSNREFDDRITAIEIQSRRAVNLLGSVLGAIVPKPFLDKPGVAAQIAKDWGGLPIPYNVKEEFDPKEIQGAIFDRLSDFLQQGGVL